jgi:Siphovirus Gp157
MANETRKIEIEKQVAMRLLATARADMDDDDILLTTIEGETNLLEAVDAALARTLVLRSLVDMLKGAEATLKRRRERLETQEETIRVGIADALKAIGANGAIERPIATVGLSKRPDKAEIVSEHDLPGEFWVDQDPKIDMTAIRAALQDGRAVPGAILKPQADGLNVRFA